MVVSQTRELTETEIVESLIVSADLFFSCFTSTCPVYRMQVRTSCVGQFTARNEDGIFGFGRPCFPLGRLSLSCQLILALEENLLARSPTRIFASAAARWYQAQRRRATRILLHDP